MSRLSDNLRLARHAIRYVDSLHIVSNNVVFRPSYFSDFDSFLLGACRGRISPDKKIQRNELLTILRDTNLSKGEKKRQLQQKMHAWGPGYFGGGFGLKHWDGNKPAYMDEN